ncbi:nucleoside hydrolase [Actinoallomurus purpureus]|uniref:nucleoside hydrolase n=1 Tax=Actinoallomurus purpureus TaxID=478114 RepID=UPI0020936F20|nr:nucleoside hydrolase [Actinoallomurus purpureus]MCO6006936.1 nucleoside hydrolase [Actinoallomurus purpureus]
MPTPLIIDTDPGLDDALAILLALGSPEVDLIGVTTVAGNTSLANTTDNALRILELAGRTDIPVAAGASRALIREAPRTAEYVHGSDGLGGLPLPAPSVPPVASHAVTFLAERLLSTPKPVTVAAIGPLTNIALLVATHPEAAARIGRLVVMGGAARGGNVAPTAEFNIWSDPEAAHRVFSAGLPLTMIGLDVTDRSVITVGDVNGMGDGRVARFVEDSVGFYGRFHQDRYGTTDTYQHDALALAEVIIPGIVETSHHYVTVDCGETLSRGTTIVDLNDVTGHPPNAHVALEFDHPRFVEVLVGRLKDLDTKVR